jgi:hypothetical protein
MARKAIHFCVTSLEDLLGIDPDSSVAYIVQRCYDRILAANPTLAWPIYICFAKGGNMLIRAFCLYSLSILFRAHFHALGRPCQKTIQMALMAPVPALRIDRIKKPLLLARGQTQDPSCPRRPQLQESWEPRNQQLFRWYHSPACFWQLYFAREVVPGNSNIAFLFAGLNRWRLSAVALLRDRWWHLYGTGNY